MNLNRAKCGTLNLSGARTKEIQLRFAEIADLGNLTGTIIEGDLDLEMSKIGGNLFLRDGAQFKCVYLWDATVRGTISVRNASFGGILDMDGVSAGAVSLSTNVVCSKGVKLTAAHIAQDVEFVGATFCGVVDLTDARIGSSLVLDSHNLSGSACSENAELILKDATAQSFSISRDQIVDRWPRRTDLNGFEYRRVMGFADDRTVTEGVGRDRTFLIQWLAKDRLYTTQPYQQLAEVLVDQGEVGEGNKVLFAGRERKRKESTGFRRVGYELLKWTIGYGIGAGRLCGLLLSLSWEHLYLLPSYISTGQDRALG